MRKEFIFLGVFLVALFLIGCATQKVVDKKQAEVETTLDSDIASLDNSSSTDSVDSGLTEVSKDLNSL